MSNMKSKVTSLEDNKIEFAYDDYTVVVSEINIGEEDEHGNMDLILDYEVTAGTPPDDYEEVLGHSVLDILQKAAKYAED